VSAEKALALWAGLGQAGQSDLGKFICKLLRGQVDLSEDLAKKRSGDVAATMMWYGRTSPVWVPIENVTSFLPDLLEAEI